MSMKGYNALLILANEQGIQLETVTDFLQFASVNYSKEYLSTT